MPGSERPSSTSVMATAGRMPTSTVSASRIRDMAAICPNIRPIKESTTSSAEISISTPRACTLTMRSVRSSCRDMARRSCISTWMLTRRNSPILRIGIRSKAGLQLGISMHALNRLSGPPQRQSESIGQCGFGHDRPQLHSQMHDGGCNLRPDAADNAFGAHQARRRHGFHQVLRNQRVYRRYARDIDDGNAGARLDDALKQALHYHLGALAIKSADERQCQNSVPQLDYWSGEL